MNRGMGGEGADPGDPVSKTLIRCRSYVHGFYLVVFYAML